jgi:hypothetical protein
MRRRFVMRGGRLVELDLETPRPPSVAPMIIGDIEPYRSMRTGEIITGRAQHREHLALYGLVEVGNEWEAFSRPQRPPPGPEPGEVAAEVKRQLERDPGERRAEAERVLQGAGYAGPQVERILKD